MLKGISKGKLSHIQHTMLAHIRNHVDHKAKFVGNGTIRYRIWDGQKTFYKFGRRIKVLDMKHIDLDSQIKSFEELYSD